MSKRNDDVRIDAKKAAELLNKLPSEARQRICYIIQGAALVSGILDKPVSKT